MITSPAVSAKTRWTETVTVRIWANGADGKPMFLDPVPGAKARRLTPTKDGKEVLHVHNKHLLHLSPKSEITDAKGDVYVVTKVNRHMGFMLVHAVEKY